MRLTDAEAVNGTLVPLLRAGTHVALFTDNDPGRTALVVYQTALIAVGVPGDAIVTADLHLIDPRDYRTWKVSLMAARKDELPRRFAAGVADAYGAALRPGQDLIVLSREAEQLGTLLLAVMSGGFRPHKPGMN